MGVIKWFITKNIQGMVLGVHRTEWNGLAMVKEETWQENSHEWKTTRIVYEGLHGGDPLLDEVDFKDVAHMLPEKATIDKSVKTGVPSVLEVQRALSRLEILPNPADPALDDETLEKLVESPWAIRPVPTIDPLKWDDAVLETIEIASLLGTDPYLKRKKVKEHINSMGQAVTEFRSYPLIYETNNEPIIIDGHHRLMAMWLLGLDKAPVWITKE